MPDPAPLATAPHPDKEKPLPPPPALPFPTAELVSLYQQLPSRPPPADVQLDARSWEHVRDLLEQSMFSSKVAQESVWVDLFMTVLHSLGDFLTAEVIEGVTSSTTAEWKSSELARRGKGNDKKGKSKEKDKDRDKKGKEKDASSLEVDFKARQERRDEWRAAITILRGRVEDSTTTAPVVGDAGSSTAASIDPVEIKDTSGDPDTTEPLEVKLKHFAIRLATTETTMGAIKAGSSQLDVKFVQGDWSGEALFGRDPVEELDEEDLQLIERVGGTFHLTSTPRDVLKLARILELLVFTVISLLLESSLLHDTSCPRPTLEAEVESMVEAVTPTRQSKDEDRAEDAQVGDNSERRGKYKWSKINLWSLLVGSQDSGSSLERTVTSSSHSTSPEDTPKPIKNRIKSFGQGFRRRKAITRRKSGSVGTSGSRGPSLDFDDIDNGWDFISSLGLGVSTPRVAVSESYASKRSASSTVGEDSIVEAKETTERFQKVIQQMEKCILSTSPDVVYPPPHLLVRLRLQEVEQSLVTSSTPAYDSSLTPSKSNPFLSSPPRPHLDRLRSFTTIDAQTLAIDFASGTQGGHLERGSLPASISSQSSRATRITLDARAGLASLLTNNNSLGGTIRHQGMQFLVETIRDEPGARPCKTPRWITCDYYDKGPPGDDARDPESENVSLGRLIESMVEERDRMCETVGCKKLGRDHSVYWLHSTERIGITLVSLPPSSDLPLSFDTFVPPFDSITPRILNWTTCNTCHAMTTPALLSPATYAISFAKFAELLLYDANFVPLPELCEHSSRDRGVLVRSFAVGSTVVRIEVDQIELFELRLPTSVDPDIDHQAAEENEAKPNGGASVDTLRNEIQRFFASVAQRIDVLESLVEGRSPPTTIKAPPAAPVDAAYAEVAPIEEGVAHVRSESEKTILERGAAEEETIEPGVDTLRSSLLPLGLLVKLRHGIEEAELDTLAGIEDLDPHHLNQGRWIFVAKGNGVKARIAAWEKKHAASLIGPMPLLSYDEPDYFQPRTHVFPLDSSIVMREEELSSLIALTLSAPSFQEEVTTPSSAFPSRKVTPQSLFAPPTPGSSRKSSRQPIPMELLEAPRQPSATMSRSSTPPRSPRIPATLDPDDPSVDFGPIDDFESRVKPKKATRAGSSILAASLRGLARQKSSDSSGFFRSSPLITPTGEGSQLGDDKRSLRNLPLPDSVLEDLITTADVPPPSPKPSLSHSRAVPSVISGLMHRHPSDVTTTSSLSLNIAELDTTRNRGRPISSSSRSSLHDSATDSSVDGDEEDDDPLELPERPGSSLLTGSLNALWNLPGSLRIRNVGSPKISSTSENAGHVKFNFKSGDRAFRVTSYFAQRFQALRSRSGLSESLFIESLSRCSDIHTDGGKSTAKFLMTGDSRFMLKELTSGWGVSERDAFLAFAPSLLTYLMAPERPSLLAKIFGFYTVKIKNTKTGETSKLDLVVMEHLFHAQTITRQFDLKGVASRVAKATPGTESTGTGWDGDWLSGSLQNRLLIYAHSKTLLRDALLNDTNFLATSGNIDYSLLVGVDDTKKELVVGLIDTLGVFNALKMLENAGKTALKKATASDADAVTVIPPSDYASRFRAAMELYFVSVPEKFSRPPGDAAMNPDPRLSSIL